MFKKILRIFFKIMFFLLLIAFAVGLILFGLYYGKISDKEYIFGNMVDMVFDKTESIFTIDKDYITGDNFSVDGSIKMTLSSEEYKNKSVTDIEFKKKNNMLNNLSKMDTTFKVQHDKKHEQVYAELDEKIGNEEIFAGKYYVANSTRYFFVNSILKNYVNDGSNTYFESYKEDITTTDNINYLYNFIRDSIKNNINNEVLSGYDVDTLVGDHTIKAGQISYRITDKSYKQLLKGILKDLKKDERAHQILSVIYPNLDDLKVNEKKKYFKSNESYTISVYVSKPMFKPVKYEVVYLKDDQKNIYTYEGDKKDGIFYYSENNEVKYRATYHSTDKKIDVLVYNRSNEEIGTIKGEKDKNSLSLILTLDLGDKNYDISYSSKNKDLKNKSYTREDLLTFKIMDEKIVKIQGNVECISKITNKVKIMEDTSSSELRSTLTDEDNNKIDTIKDRVKERLEK